MSNQNEKRWLNLWKRIGMRGDGRKAYADLVARYSESHRAYHTLVHVEHCLDEFELARHLARDPDAVEFALWYHDAVYDTKAKDNEEKSANLALEVIRGAGLSDDFGERVAKLILAIKQVESQTDTDAQLVVDIDLSILGQSEEEFDKYEHQIRDEYSWVPREAFVAGRSSILKSFLDRPATYMTNFFKDKYERQARQNIARSLTQLSKSP